MSIFKTYGVEIEMDSDDYVCHEDIWDELEHIGGASEVKDDGSLDYGAEINSNVMDSIEAMFRYIKEANNILSDYGCYPKSPSALHIHIKGHKKPTNLHHMAYKLYPIFSHIVNTNKSGLYLDRNIFKHNSMTREALGSGLIMKNNLDFEHFCSRFNERFFQQYRASTLRTRGYGSGTTLEFRPIPNRTYEPYLDVWEKIYTQMIKQSEAMTLKEAEEYAMGSDYGLTEAFIDFRNRFNLSYKELHILLYKVTSDSLEDYNNIIKLGLDDYNTIYRLIRL